MAPGQNNVLMFVSNLVFKAIFSKPCDPLTHESIREQNVQPRGLGRLWNINRVE